MAKEQLLTMGRGKNKRQWALSDSEFERFERMFEENELIEMPKGQTLEEWAKGFKVTKVEI